VLDMVLRLWGRNDNGKMVVVKSQILHLVSHQGDMAFCDDES
jgi:hypothetical protein